MIFQQVESRVLFASVAKYARRELNWPDVGYGHVCRDRKVRAGERTVRSFVRWMYYISTTLERVDENSISKLETARAREYSRSMNYKSGNCLCECLCESAAPGNDVRYQYYTVTVAYTRTETHTGKGFILLDIIRRNAYICIIITVTVGMIIDNNRSSSTTVRLVTSSLWTEDTISRDRIYRYLEIEVYLPKEASPVLSLPSLFSI